MKLRLNLSGKITLILNKCGAVQEDYEKYFQKGH